METKDTEYKEDKDPDDFIKYLICLNNSFE